MNQLPTSHTLCSINAAILLASSVTNSTALRSATAMCATALRSQLHCMAPTAALTALHTHIECTHMQAAAIERRDREL
jgi:hypothetical protein